jgi:hypothetical protein
MTSYFAIIWTSLSEIAERKKEAAMPFDVALKIKDRRSI